MQGTRKEVKKKKKNREVRGLTYAVRGGGRAGTASDAVPQLRNASPFRALVFWPVGGRGRGQADAEGDNKAGKVHFKRL